MGLLLAFQRLVQPVCFVEFLRAYYRMSRLFRLLENAIALGYDVVLVCVPQCCGCFRVAIALNRLLSAHWHTMTVCVFVLPLGYSSTLLLQNT